MLEVEQLSAAYGRIEVLNRVGLTVPDGQLVALIGANGAGKTTLMRCLSGLMPARGGTIRFNGEDLQRVAAHQRSARGLLHSPEGRQVFTNLSVQDNLRMGGYLRGGLKDSALLAEVLDLFPLLRERLHQLAGTLSGGQQQMLAIARALMGRPKCLLLDEPSLGLAPIVVKQLLRVIASLRDKGLSILLVEQNAMAALSIANYAYVLTAGQIVLQGPAAELKHNPHVRRAFLGL